jgi:hypothetical protein
MIRLARAPRLGFMSADDQTNSVDTTSPTPWYANWELWALVAVVAFVVFDKIFNPAKKVYARRKAAQAYAKRYEQAKEEF